MGPIAYRPLLQRSKQSDLKSRVSITKTLLNCRTRGHNRHADTDGGVDRASPRLHRNRRSNRMHRVGRSGLDSAR
jgi:hypothetical protein